MMAQAMYHRFDGRVVKITAWNAPSPTTDATPQHAAVLSTQEFLEIVQDPDWFNPS